MELKSVCEALVRRGYEAKVVSAAEAVESVAALLTGVQNVGWGGSETVKELGIRDMVAKSGIEVRDHRTDCDLFLLSANALTTDGRIVNIDGSGNRVAASVYGPKRVVYLIGRNKIVDGGIDEALARIHREACPLNCRRLGKKTPCSVGECPWFKNGQGCDSPDRICKVTAIFDRPPSRTPTTVLLVDGDFGY